MVTAWSIFQMLLQVVHIPPEFLKSVRAVLGTPLGPFHSGDARAPWAFVSIIRWWASIAPAARPRVHAATGPAICAATRTGIEPAAGARVTCAAWSRVTHALRQG